MIKRLFILMFLLSFFQGCQENPQQVGSIKPEDRYPISDTIIKITSDTVIKITSADTIIKLTIEQKTGVRTIADLFNDTITPPSKKDSTDTTGAVDSAEVRFYLDIRNHRVLLKMTVNDGLPKILTNSRKLIADLRRDSVNAITFQFVPLDPNNKDTIKVQYEVVNGVCATNSIRIPSGYKYEVLVSLWRVQEYPWDNTRFLYDRAFSALDTVNLLAKSSDTLNMTFYESEKIKYFAALELPNGLGAWTEGKTYSAFVGSIKTSVLYKNKTLFFGYLCEDIGESTVSMIRVDCDTGRVTISFFPNLLTMISDGIVEVSSADIMEGAYEDPSWVPLEPLPHRERE